MLKKLELLFTVILVPGSLQSVVYNITMLIDVLEEVNACLRDQARYQPKIPAALGQLTQTEFNERCQQVFTNVLPVRWPRTEMIMRTVTTGNFRPEIVFMLGLFQDQLRATIKLQE